MLDPFVERGRYIVRVKRPSGAWRKVALPRGATLEQARELQLQLELDALHVQLRGELPTPAPRPLLEIWEWWRTSTGSARVSASLPAIRSRFSG